MAANKLPDQYQFAKQFLDQVLNDPNNAGATISITGHSLGGSLTQLLAAETGLTATTFNPYGAKDLIPAINARYGLSLDPNATYDNITNHQTLLDGVSRLGSSSPFGSDQLGQMQTHVAASELAAALMVAGAMAKGPASGMAAYLAVDFYWSHSIDRFTQEIYPQEALAAQVGRGFSDFVRTLNDQINAIEQAGATAQANLQNDFMQLAGTAGQTYQDAIDTTSSAMGQLAGLLSAAEQSAAKTFLDFAFDLGDTINGIEQAVADTFTAAARWIQPVVGGRDPLTFDLNGNGIETVPINPANPILFDHTGSGMKVATGWIAPSDGFLVLDRNANGKIDNGAELFGDSTPLASGGNAADGFAALAAQDTNADGLVNTLDANFANLRIWQDLNQDGISFVDANGNGILDAGETSELKTLAELDIASIKVAKTEHSQVLANGNEITDLGSFTRTDGSVGGMGVTSALADVSGRVAAQQRGTHRPTPCGCNLASDTFRRMFVDAVPLDPLAATLPDNTPHSGLLRRRLTFRLSRASGGQNHMQGSGAVRDLRQAASLGACALQPSGANDDNHEDRRAA